MKIPKKIEDKILFFVPIVLLAIFCLQTYRPLVRKFGISEFSFSMSFLVFSILAFVNIFISYISQYLINNKGSASIFALMLSWVALYYGYFIKFLKSITGDFLLNTFFSISYQKILIIILFIGFFIILKSYKNDLRAFGLFISYCCMFFLITETYITLKDLIIERKVKIGKPNLIVNNNKSNIQPDIYYFVCDAYTSNASLGKLNFSNAEFKNTLQKQGFFIAENSHSNYPITYPSLASSFNMNYADLNVNELISFNQKNMLDNYIQSNVLFDILLKRNYKLITLSHLFNNGMVHELNRRNRSYYYWEVTKGSIYYPFIYKSIDMLSNLKDSKLKSQMDSYNYNVNLPRVVDSVSNNNIGPKFVYAHFMVTHPPYVFNADGTFNYHENDQALVPEYIDQVKILNKQLTTIIDSILKRNRSNSVIIVQADHGSHLLNVNETFTIQNNYYFPDLDYTLLHQNISPVNSFRVVLNKYFGQQLPLLEDKSIGVNY